ncbi:MAG: GNAT family N-acetyltransferase [Gammaproteobacteria bacterium]|nr:GNAT family N-acetyltransferase [Gammaproteobacteria bacterium]
MLDYAMDYFPYVQGLAETVAFVEHIKRHYRQYGYALYAVELKQTGEFIGFVGLNHVNFTIPAFVPKKLPVAEIGWRLAADYWGQGFATEAAKAVLHYAFTKLDLLEVVSFTSAINQPSCGVMEKIGLHHDEKDDFDHPKIDKNSRLYRHVLGIV